MDICRSMSAGAESNKTATEEAGFTRTSGFRDESYTAWTPPEGGDVGLSPGDKKRGRAAWRDQAMDAIEKLREIGRAWFGLVVAGAIILTFGQEELKRAEREKEPKPVVRKGREDRLESWAWHTA